MQSLDIETVVVVVCCLLFYTRSSVFPVDARRLFKSSRPMSRLFEARLSAGLAGVFFLLSICSSSLDFVEAFPGCWFEITCYLLVDMSHVFLSLHIA